MPNKSIACDKDSEALLFWYYVSRKHDQYDVLKKYIQEFRKGYNKRIQLKYARFDIEGGEW